MVLLHDMTSSKMQLKQQLQDTLAALLTSRSNAESAGALAAQAIAEKQRYKAALLEMRACVEEMYVFHLQAVDLTTREPFSNSSNQQLVVQAAASHSSSACRSMPSFVAPRDTEGCSTSITLDAKENVQPAPCAFSISSRRRLRPETRKFVLLPHIRSPAEAAPSPVNKQSLSARIATEGYSHVTMRYTDDAKTCNAQLSRSAPTAPEANNINTANSIQALATAAKAVHSAASKSLLSPAATAANNRTESRCAPSAVQGGHDTTTNINATINDCANCHRPAAKKTHMKGSVAASRWDTPFSTTG